jgi:hypothetical protein
MTINSATRTLQLNNTVIRRTTTLTSMTKFYRLVTDNNTKSEKIHNNKRYRQEDDHQHRYNLQCQETSWMRKFWTVINDNAR